MIITQSRNCKAEAFHQFEISFASLLRSIGGLGGSILESVALCKLSGNWPAGELDAWATADAILDVESWDTVRWNFGLLADRRKGYRQGDFGTSVWKALFSIPSPRISFIVCSRVLEDKRLNILEPKLGGSSSPPLLFLLRYRTSCDSSRITWRSYGVS